jgi:uncharacterized protein YdeI (YjbR/CyaY-like superfamily)
MGSRDPRVDAYIANSADFARPVLTYLRELIHETCPDVEETLKWRMPSFMYRGILCGFAAFREHCTFGFWKGSLIVADRRKSLDAMGSFGRITKRTDLPSKAVLRGYIKQAMALNEDGIRAPAKRPTGPRPPLRTPFDLAAALKTNGAARAAYDGFSPSRKREYVEWITEAKTPATRARRVATALEWLGEGKSRNWKYVKSVETARSRSRRS